MEKEEFINYFLQVFKVFRNNTKILNKLVEKGILYPSFEKRYILNGNDYDFRLIETLSEGDNSIYFFVETEDGSPFRIELFFDKKWYIRSFLFQCQSCFGDDTECSVCGGIGWGVL
jgi:hypothetical protein